MPVKSKKTVKTKVVTAEFPESKPLKKPVVPEIPVEKPTTKIKVEEIDTEVPEPETAEPIQEEISKEPSKEPPASEESKMGITSFSQLDTQVPGESASVKEAPTRSILEPEKEEAPEPESEPEKPDDEKEEKYEAEEKTPGKEEKGEISSDEIKEWLKEVRPDTTKEVEKSSKSNFSGIFVVLIVLLLLGAAAGGFYYYKTKVGGTPKQEESVAQETPTSVPTATPVDAVDYSKYVLRVNNGSGVAGEAGRVAKLFEDIKFKEVTAGNADKSDYTITVVSYKKDVPEGVFEKVKEILSTTYSVEKAEESLSDTSDYDVVITVGTKKAE